MDTNLLFNIEYGLHVVTTSFDNKDNGCIINTLMQVTSNPCQIQIVINKQNYTTELIKKSKKFNISILSTNTPFEVFKQFGFQSGKNTNKFKNIHYIDRSNNNILYLNKYSNSVLCATVVNEIDLGTHILFIAKLDDTIKISGEPSVTYNYYHKNIKPKPQSTEKSGWRCKICGYVYEGENLPDDFICPLCKHGAADFEKI